MKIITVVGRSGSGKTTLVERLIERFRARGLAVSAVKSIRHEFHMDRPGKDTYRLREAGARGVAITNGESYASIGTLLPGRSPLELGLFLFPASDVLIIEGYKEGDTWKIEVVGDSAEDPLYASGVDNIRIVVSDRSLETCLPVYGRDDVDGILSAVDGILAGEAVSGVLDE